MARQSNLIVIVDHPVSRAELKRQLIEEIKKQNLKFGLYFDDIQGGFTLTSRFTPNAFNVLPIMVYRIYPDGREELVRVPGSRLRRPRSSGSFREVRSRALLQSNPRGRAGT